MDEQQVLDDELEVGQTADPALQVVSPARLLELSPHGEHLGRSDSRIDRRGEDRADRVGDVPAEAAGGEDDAGPRQGQSLPGLGGVLEVGAEGGQRHDQGAGGAVRAEPGVDLVERARRGVAAERLEHPLGDLGDELLVGDRRAGPDGLAVLLVEEDQVEVAVVVQLAAAELAQGEDRPAVAPAVALAGRECRWRSARRCHWSRATWVTIASATSASSRVTSRIGSRPRMSRVPIRTHSLLRKLQRIGARSSAPLHSSASSALIAAAGQGPIDDQRVHQVVDHAGVVDQDLRRGTGWSRTARRRAAGWAD